MVDSVTGRVQRVIFSQDDYHIFKLHEVPSKNDVVVQGNLFGLSRICYGVPLCVFGEWKKHPKYGLQFVIQNWEPWSPDSKGVETFLCNCVEGFPWNLANAVSKQGPEAFKDLLAAIGRVSGELDPPLGEDDLQRATLGWERAIAARDMASFLRTSGMKALEIQLALAYFGVNGVQIVRANPWRLLEVLRDFKRVDRFAVNLGFQYDCVERTAGAVLWALREGGLQGHLYLQRSEVSKIIDRLFQEHSLIPLGRSNFDSAVENLVLQKAVVLEDGVGLYLAPYHVYERRSAEILSSLLNVPTSNVEANLSEFLLNYERSNHIALSDAQREAVERLAQSRVLVLTGLPGTGKTTAVRALVRFFEEAKISFSLMAPTGIAAKRLASVTGHDASTIHRALRYDGSQWGHGPNNRYVRDAVIVDEMSMVNQELFYRLLSALRPDTQVVLVGDAAQLPSVGPGNVLAELVTCDCLPNVKLTQIFRQSEKGEIVLNAHRINKGESLSLPSVKDGEFRFIRLNDERRIVEFIMSMAERLKSRNANFQVLSPKYDGVVGVNNLNEHLRERLNPSGPPEWKRGSLHFRQGDRLMVIQNDYERSVYNGDMGKLVAIEKDALVVRIHGLGENDLDMEVEFPIAMVEDKLRLAYAISVHKSQGSEFDTIILPVVKSQGRMLQRNLLYTAVTRARKCVWLLGEETAIQRAIQNDHVVKRNTVFGRCILTPSSTCRDG